MPFPRLSNAVRTALSSGPLSYYLRGAAQVFGEGLFPRRHVAPPDHEALGNDISAVMRDMDLGIRKAARHMKDHQP